MIELRVTKYDPACRDATGRYRIEDWTSVSDIGKRFHGAILDEAAYRAVEDAYVDTIEALLADGDAGPLVISGLEARDFEDPLHEATTTPDWIREGNAVNGARRRQLIRLCLREALWCRLESPQTFVHFGYDYHAYVGVARVHAATLAAAQLRRIFVEEHTSPHHAG